MNVHKQQSAAAEARRRRLVLAYMSDGLSYAEARNKLSDDAAADRQAAENARMKRLGYTKEEYRTSSGRVVTLHYRDRDHRQKLVSRVETIFAILGRNNRCESRGASKPAPKPGPTISPFIKPTPPAKPVKPVPTTRPAKPQPVLDP